MRNLSALFDRPSPYYWVPSNDPQIIKAQFSTPNGDTCTVQFVNFDDTKTTVIEFLVSQNGGEATQELTGTGGEVSIFSTVVAISLEYIKKNHPQNIEFSAKDSDKGRVNLYSKFAERLAKLVSGEVSSEKGDNYTYFTVKVK